LYITLYILGNVKLEYKVTYIKEYHGILDMSKTLVAYHYYAFPWYFWIVIVHVLLMTKILSSLTADCIMKDRLYCTNMLHKPMIPAQRRCTRGWCSNLWPKHVV